MRLTDYKLDNRGGNGRTQESPYDGNAVISSVGDDSISSRIRTVGQGLAPAEKDGDQSEIQLYQNLRNQKMSLFANSDFTALAQAAQESGDMELAQIYEALHNQKEEFLRNSDFQALINEAEQAEKYVKYAGG